MTTAIEETRREMYAKLELAKNRFNAWFGNDAMIGSLESALEAHLEELRKDLNFACAALDVEAARRTKLVQERDDIQLRLHAIDHAYFVQSEANRVAGEELRRARALIREQQESISKLYRAQEQRKDQGAMSACAQGENVYSAKSQHDTGIPNQYLGSCTGKCRSGTVEMWETKCRFCGEAFR